MTISKKPHSNPQASRIRFRREGECERERNAASFQVSPEAVTVIMVTSVVLYVSTSLIRQ